MDMCTIELAAKPDETKLLHTHLAAILVDVLKYLANLHARDEPQRQNVQRGREYKLPLASEYRSTFRETVVWCRVRVLCLARSNNNDSIVKHGVTGCDVFV